MIKQLSRVPDFYQWNIYSGINDLYEARYNAFKNFISDCELDRLKTRNGIITTNRYIHAILPTLPFENATFDLVLSSNLLFYYHNMFDYHFHQILEMDLVFIIGSNVSSITKGDITNESSFNVCIFQAGSVGFRTI